MSGGFDETLWISKFKNFGKIIFLGTPPNRKYSMINKATIQNEIISSSLEQNWSSGSSRGDC